MDIYDRHGELEEIVDTLDSLADDVTDKYYKDMINDLKYEVQTDLDEVDKEISKLEKKELEEENRQFERSRL